VGFGTYFLIDRHFQQTTDLALQYKMATEFRLLGLPIPPELLEAEASWLQDNSREIPQPRPTAVLSSDSSYSTDDEHGDDEGTQTHEPENYLEDDHLYDADLAAVFVSSLDAEGTPILSPNLAAPPSINSPELLEAVRQTGYDLRTIDLPGKGRIRLLTYRTGAAVPALLQTGRLLNDQDRLLEQTLLYLVVLGGASSLLLAVISWWLAGRSLGPAQRAWDQQQTFVSNASHELRTPLTLIRATADYNMRKKPPEEYAQHLADILNECDYMDHLVDDLLLLSRLDAHRLKLDLEPLPLSELFSETVRQISKLARADKVTIISNGHAGTVRGDRTRLRQVLLILLDNALRFTPDGGTIHLSAQLRGNRVHIDVADSGSGIAPEHLPHLFERFYQVSTPENRAGRSNGLGLSIARALVEAQGGTIQIESQVGKGTNVRIIMPAR
jgi:signal transduction histidine kinase